MILTIKRDDVNKIQSYLLIFLFPGIWHLLYQEYRRPSYFSTHGIWRLLYHSTVSHSILLINSPVIVFPWTLTFVVMSKICIQRLLRDVSIWWVVSLSSFSLHVPTREKGFRLFFINTTSPNIIRLRNLGIYAHHLQNGTI